MRRPPITTTHGPAPHRLAAHHDPADRRTTASTRTRTRATTMAAPRRRTSSDGRGPPRRADAERPTPRTGSPAERPVAIRDVDIASSHANVASGRPKVTVGRIDIDNGDIDNGNVGHVGISQTGAGKIRVGRISVGQIRVGHVNLPGASIRPLEHLSDSYTAATHTSPDTLEQTFEIRRPADYRQGRSVVDDRARRSEHGESTRTGQKLLIGQSG
ncbi:hypothetical protein Ga0074812_105250 [Parafrankia irregularis]|uniref:Uncharacterized protein n=1 Tax=Parafrankia irregularis TaxID=795642 RepID=A0A0S4QJY7_9ACTN|nr:MULTISPECIES: hypothetical protein [Parafrankia]MBE3205506.1 hypothetical protein [Parafrankia sp. CH37]CUU55598.1 hypothetical protein Ga0074812_105250 [Parafrankia irregularis]